MDVGFIGIGNMGSAIIEGIINAEIPVSLYTYDIDNTKAEKIPNISATICDDAREVVSICKYVFLCVKPQVMEGLLSDIEMHVSDDTVIVSIAAGISGHFIQKRLRDGIKVIQVMPNTPLMLGEGATALSSFAPTTKEEFDFVKNIFDAIGIAEEVPNEKMNEIIAVNGSSPAFIYLFAKGFLEYAANSGLDRDTALRLFSQSLIGSAKMLTDSGYSVDELITMVSSPGGTTIAGLDSFYDSGFTSSIVNACNACLRRADELSPKPFVPKREEDF
ncbi:MAG: pyrroline-5-carboxylate reductase [Ruminococcus sp.]|jgi:pyrroline-5-carboxylate reductase|nr:pyrroline-5-carboxylate reductase [Ruminococcus sp.]